MAHRFIDNERFKAQAVQSAVRHNNHGCLMRDQPGRRTDQRPIESARPAFVFVEQVARAKNHALVLVDKPLNFLPGRKREQRDSAGSNHPEVRVYRSQPVGKEYRVDGTRLLPQSRRGDGRYRFSAAADLLPEKLRAAAIRDLKGPFRMFVPDLEGNVIGVEIDQTRQEKHFRCIEFQVVARSLHYPDRLAELRLRPSFHRSPRIQFRQLGVRCPSQDVAGIA